MNNRLRLVLRGLAKSEWFDLYHIHPSLYGYKKRDLDLLCAIEEKARRMLSRRFRAFQCFIVVDTVNSDHDAVYLHTENANGSEFPVDHTRGGVTRSVWRYRSIMVPLARKGYVCYKLRGWPSVVAVHRDLAR